LRDSVAAQPPRRYRDSIDSIGARTFSLIAFIEAVVGGQSTRTRPVVVPWRHGRVVAAGGSVAPNFRLFGRKTLTHRCLRPYSLGIALKKSGRLVEAVAAFQQVVDVHGSDADPGLRALVAVALFSQGVVLGVQGRSGDAAAAYRRVVNHYGQYPTPGLRKLVGAAMVNQLALGELAGSPDAVVACRQIDVDRIELTITYSDKMPPQRLNLAAETHGSEAIWREAHSALPIETHP
jgi:hypothetical protein